MQQPLVSIIIPTYNRAHLIGETLDSVLAQTYTNWECIVVDDGSTDNTTEVIKNYLDKDPRFQYHHRPADRPKGANACRNYGFELSEGEFVNWFDSDDIMHPSKLKTQIKALKNSELNFSVCQTMVFVETIENIKGLKHPSVCSDNVFEDYITKQIVWLTQAPLWKRNFLLALDELFDEELQSSQEWEFHTRILYSNREYHYTNEALVFVREHKNSLSYNVENERRYLNYFLSRYKIYILFKENLNEKTTQYLRNHLIVYFKKLVEIKSVNKSFKVFFRFILYDKNIKSRYKFYAFVSILTYKVFNKGFKMLNKIE